MKSKRTKACEIPKKVKEIVYERENRRCLYCGSPYCLPEAHIIPRSKGGLGVEQNIICVCRRCHMRLDQSIHRKEMLDYAINYLKGIYPDWNEKELIYDKRNTK